MPPFSAFRAVALRLPHPSFSCLFQNSRSSKNCARAYKAAVEYKYILCLTGSKLNNKSIEILKELNAPIVDSITEVEAIAKGWVAPSLEYNLAVQLDEHDKVRYAKYSESISETLEIFKGLHKQVNRLLKV